MKIQSLIWAAALMTALDSPLAFAQEDDVDQAADDGLPTDNSNDGQKISTGPQ